ncbi:MAG: hypothetical protein IIZ39_03555 [Blautia sp.]|nr:hypothetical protein [Blautia sp.]
MRNRKVQREIRHAIGREPKASQGGQEKLESKNYYGNGDPTPQKAVKNIIDRQKAAARAIRKGASHAAG